MPITHWPEEDRPREKLLRKGAASLTNAELIAIFLHTGIRDKTALDLAKELLLEFGSLKRLLNASAVEFCQKPGLGQSKYASLKAALELARRHQEENVQIGKILNNSNITRRFLGSKLQHHQDEVFVCLFLNTRNQMLAYEELFHGTLHEVHIYPRTLVKRAIMHNAAKVILAHNHPSGHPSPSQADRDITLLLSNALALIDVHIVDHIIIGANEYFSFAEAGLIS
ncbi:MAG: hypothetical protein A3E83_05365 [Gammaproteobacteria bacterium RIFCSPHIGHO2_12_FULL_41_20]|nr:MAG: hypothetical protein A3E83_05365 [Gammaproteobacteria bacterium RIFCSPHIGHO2_12_FULL_41_20]